MYYPLASSARQAVHAGRRRAGMRYAIVTSVRVPLSGPWGHIFVENEGDIMFRSLAVSFNVDAGGTRFSRAGVLVE